MLDGNEVKDKEDDECASGLRNAALFKKQYSSLQHVIDRFAPISAASSYTVTRAHTIYTGVVARARR